jgi:nucleolar protein 4
MKATTSSGSPTAKTIPRSKAHVPNPSGDPLAIRTVVVTGLPLVDSKNLWKKFRKYEGAEEVQWPIKRDDGVEDASTGSSAHPFAWILFLTVS